MKVWNFLDNPWLQQKHIHRKRPEHQLLPAVQQEQVVAADCQCNLTAHLRDKGWEMFRFPRHHGSSRLMCTPRWENRVSGLPHWEIHPEQICPTDWLTVGHPGQKTNSKLKSWHVDERDEWDSNLQIMTVRAHFIVDRTQVLIDHADRHVFMIIFQLHWGILHHLALFPRLLCTAATLVRITRRSVELNAQHSEFLLHSARKKKHQHAKLANCLFSMKPTGKTTDWLDFLRCKHISYPDFCNVAGILCIFPHVNRFGIPAPPGKHDLSSAVGTLVDKHQNYNPMFVFCHVFHVFVHELNSAGLPGCRSIQNHIRWKRGQLKCK